MDNDHNCGGSIISSNAILTAAHCLHENIIKRLSIRAGSTFRTHGGQIVGVQSVIIHKNYDPDSTENDIGIVILKTSLDFSQPGVSVIELPDQDEIVTPGTIGTVSGWGTTVWNQSACSQWLLAVNVSTISHRECKNMYADIYDVSENMLCAGHWAGGRDSCSGDSGGPFVINNKLVGIVSWGEECGVPQYPGVYTHVSRYVKWINKMLY